MGAGHLGAHVMAQSVNGSWWNQLSLTDPLRVPGPLLLPNFKGKEKKDVGTLEIPGMMEAFHEPLGICYGGSPRSLVQQQPRSVTLPSAWLELAKSGHL